MGADFKSQLTSINQGLKRVRLRRKGSRLYLRATLPPKPGDGDRAKQYEIATGCNCTPAGLKVARAKALELEGAIERERFDWHQYLKGKDKPPETVRDWIVRFEKNFWEQNPKTPSKENYLKRDFQEKFNLLPEDVPLTGELLKKIILEQTKPATRKRRAHCFAFGQLAKLAGIKGVDFTKLQAGYKAKAIAPEELPTDKQILEVWEAIKNPGWKWTIAVLATYGLRPHEIFHLDIGRLTEEPGILKVLAQTKTGSRLIWDQSPSA